MRYLFLCCLIVPLQIFAQSRDSLCKQIDGIAMMEQCAQESKVMQRYLKNTASANLDVNYYRCEWTVKPTVRYISGKVTAYYTLTSAASTVIFDLSDSLIVDRVTHFGNTLTFVHQNNTVSINLASTLNALQIDSLTIQYHGVPPNTGLGSFTQATHSGAPVIWTLSEPYGARDWWPCKNGLDDKVDSMDVFITNPIGNKGISNGIRQSELVSSDGLSVTTHWKHRYPITTYLVCLAVSNYTEFNNSVQLGAVTLPMQTFCYPENLTDFQTNTPYTLDALQLYHITFGDYPFIKEKYGHTQFSWGGGEEHQTNSFVVNAGEALTSHELGHQWFGDKITCASWVDIWLNEGFATFLSSFYMELKYPGSVVATRKSEIAKITATVGGSVKVDDTTTISRIFDSRLTYTKGSHLLYMLRWKLGDEAFFNAIRAYQKDPKLAYGFAKTIDLQQHLEAAYGQSLDSFFAKWFVGQGYPSYNITWSQIGFTSVKILVDQTTSHPSVSFFDLPLALKFKNATQEKTVVLDNKKNHEIFIRDIGFMADSVFIDPDYWLISKGNKSSKVDSIVTSSERLIVYPNPAKDAFNLLINNFVGPNVAIRLYDAVGRLVYSLDRSLYNGKEFISIPAQQFGSGQYILQVADGNNEKYIKTLTKY
jgi:aminopeptidase N